MYIFCSDDRKARSVLVNQENIDCVSAIASFYLAKKYLSMDKDTAGYSLIHGWNYIRIIIKHIFAYIEQMIFRWKES